ncbi:hypothetical protein EDD11_000527 [Mortierella claussenii]|nr:hypothetical protein EDD11_000527 [Mortierella claussenii]
MQSPPVMDLMPIQFSHRVIMMCIEEIKLRGLRHPHLFRNAFHVPSVEAGLSMLANPRKSHLFSVKMMRIDTVAGLLTTALSRTYPPLIPPHIQEMFQNPNGRFFFELLGMLPELNRYLFVEILDLCCALVDQQNFNQISHSKLAVFPGSCCFGLNEYKPNWDTRHLMGADLRRFSSAFYHAIYAYREERDLTEDELQEKLNTRARVLEDERIAALEREHGYRGAQAILRMEARIAQGLPAESPNVMKEIDLYADRKEKVVADDAISVLDIQLEDDDENGVSRVPDLDCVAEEEEEEPEVENVQAVIRDLRRSVSVASLGNSMYENQPRPPMPSASQVSLLTASTSTTTLRNGTLSPMRPMSPASSTSPISPMSPKSSIFSGPGLLSRSNTIARSVSLKLHPVSPGDIFGISQRAVEKRELEGFLAVARTVSVKRRKSAFSKRTLQQRQMHKMRVLAMAQSTTRQANSLSPMSITPMVTISMKSTRSNRRNNRPHAPQPISSSSVSVHYGIQTCSPLPTAAALRRERAKKFRKELEVYQAKGLSIEEAIHARDADLKKQRRREKRAKQAALLKAEAEREAAAAAAAAAVIAEHAGFVNFGATANSHELSAEEAEILEAFDYLSDEEFREFKELAGLTDQDISAIQAKAAALSLSKVTQDIQTASVSAAEVEEVVVAPRTVKQQQKAEQKKRYSVIASMSTEAMAAAAKEQAVQHPVPATAHADAAATTDVEEQATSGTHNRPFNIRHMTSMDMMFKHASVVGDANLRLYPTRPSSPTISDYESDSMHGGLLSRAASVMRNRHMIDDDEEDYEDDNCLDESFDSVANFPQIPQTVPGQSATMTMPTIPYATRPKAVMLMTSSSRSSSDMVVSADAAEDIGVAAPQQQMNNYQHHVKNAFLFETVVVNDEIEYGTIANGDDDVAFGQQQSETEEEAELRELLESMSEEERSEFLRLSSQDAMGPNMSIAPSVLV